MEGPWEFGGDLIIVVDFDASKRLKDLEFIYTPAWVRVFNLPLGMMNTATGMRIGNKVGKALMVDADTDGSAVGTYLRVKVRVDIRKPLLRGVMLEDEDEVKGGWCPFRYEFLPNFCYACGLLGHVERDCDVGVGKEEQQQFGDWLRVTPAKWKMPGESRSRWSEGGSSESSRQWRSMDSGGRSSGKEKPKQLSLKDSSHDDPDLRGDGTSPIKNTKRAQGEGGEASRKLPFGTDNKGGEKEEEEQQKRVNDNQLKEGQIGLARGE